MLPVLLTVASSNSKAPSLNLTRFPSILILLPILAPSHHVTLHKTSASRMYFPSLYFSEFSKALSYFHPTVSLHWRQLMSLTMWRPVVILLSFGSPHSILTTLWKR